MAVSNVRLGTGAVLLAFALPITIEAVRGGTAPIAPLPPEVRVAEKVHGVLSDLGFTDMSRPQRRGDVLIVDARGTNGEWRTVLVDADSHRFIGEARRASHLRPGPPDSEASE